MTSNFSTIGYGKKAAKLIELVKKAEGKRYVDSDTWRVHPSNDPNFVYSPKYMICTPKQLNDGFQHFIEWLDDNPDFVEKARNGNSLDEIKEDESFLAFHKTFRNDGDENKTIQFWICKTKQEATGYLWQVWQTLDDPDEPEDENIFKTMLENGSIIWRDEWVRKCNGDLFGVLSIDNINNFSIDVDKLLKKSVTIDGKLCDSF